MNSREILRSRSVCPLGLSQLDAEEGSFLFQARCELIWDWDAFYKLTSAMYEIADSYRKNDYIEIWIAQRFWLCETWIREWTSHPDFPRPPEPSYSDALELIQNLTSFLLMGKSPYEDDTLKTKAKGSLFAQ